MAGIVTPSGKGMGCHRSLTLFNTPRWAPTAEELAALPARVDLRTNPATPPIGDQGQLGSCTAWAATRMARYVYTIEGYHNNFEASELFQYYNERLLMGTTGSDSGASITTAMQALFQYGMCGEHWWPYDIAQFTVQPPQAAYQNAQRHLAHQQVVIQQDVAHLKASLAGGYPVDLGFLVFNGYEQVGSGGQVPLPRPGEQPLGGHSNCIWGYDDNQPCAGEVGAFLFANQWGTSWGMDGYAWVPYSYVQDPNLAFDFHSLRKQS